MKKWWPVVLLALITYVVFHQAWSATFVLWDDDALIQNNSILSKSFFDALSTSFSVYYHGDYFPITLMSYWLDVYFFGMSAQAMHLVNLILQIINITLLFVFLFRFSQNKILAFIVTLFFSIHPLQTETVMWISERKSLLSAFFTFISLNFYLESLESNRIRKHLGYSVSVVTFGLACLAKATTIFLPVIYLVLDMFYFEANKKKAFFRNVIYWMLAGFLMLFRIKAYTSSVGQVSSQIFDLTRIQHIPAMALNAIGIYIGKFFVPLNLAALYPNYTFSYKVLITSAVVLITLFFLTIKVIRQKNKISWFFYLWFILFLIPVLQIFPRINYINDRYMYLPIIGFVGLMFSLFPNFNKYITFQNNLQKMILISFIYLLGVTSYAWSSVWLNNRSLWLNTIKVYPESAIAHNNLGLDYQKSEDFDLAIRQYELILQNAVDISNKLLAYNNLANVLANPKYKNFNPNRSIELLKEGLSLVTQIRESYELRSNLGIVYLKTQRFQEAKEVFQAILIDLQKEPDFRFQWLKPVIKNFLKTIPP